MSNSNFGYRRLRLAFWCAAVILGALEAWATRNTMNPDGVSYLDMGDAYWRGDWHMAINAYWSPLYSWLTGLALKLLKPSAYWEYPAVHLVNFLVYLGALASFEFFLRTFIADRRRSAENPAEEQVATLPEWAWWTLGYSLFIWTSLVMIGMRAVTPDMCVAAFVYLATGLLLRIRAGTATRRTFVLLGVVLGFGYLAKAVMFPLSFVFLAIALFSSGSLRKAIPRVLASTLVFFAIASPLIAVLSRAKGRLTFGDTGRVNYEIYVEGAEMFIPRSGGPSHPVTEILGSPTAYEYANPIPGTYPLWYDTSYWREGIKPHFDLRGQALALATALLIYGSLFFGPLWQLNLTVASFALFLISPRPSLCLKRATANWPLLMAGISAFGLYALVHVEYRFLGAFTCLVWLAIFSGVRLPASEGSRNLITGVVIAIVATTAALLARSNLRNAALARRVDSIYSEAAHALDEKGVRPGDKIASIAQEPWGEGGGFVARLAKIQIIAEVNQPESFWSASPSTQSRVLDAFAKTGVKAILARDDPPVSVSGPSWQRLGNTPYYVNVLSNSVR